MRVAPEKMNIGALRLVEIVIFVVVDNIPTQAIRVKIPEPISVHPATKLDFESRPIFDARHLQAGEAE